MCKKQMQPELNLEKKTLSKKMSFKQENEQEYNILVALNIYFELSES